MASLPRHGGLRLVHPARRQGQVRFDGGHCGDGGNAANGGGDGNFGDIGDGSDGGDGVDGGNGDVGDVNVVTTGWLGVT